MKTKNRIWMIEHPQKRVVHFFFKAAFPWFETEFTIRLKLLLKNQYDHYIQRQAEKMEEYILKIQNDELDDLPKCPIKQIYSDLVEFDISHVWQFAFATSDDPYYEKPQNLQKYFPEAVLFDDQGNVLTTLNRQNPDKIGNYISDCRDNKIEINDDRKLVIRSSAL